MSLLFTQVKSQVTTRQAAERYGVPVNHSGMACCPFHDNHHPVTIYLPLDLWQPAIGMGHLVA